MDFAEWLPRLQELGLTWGLIVLKAVAIFFFGRIAAKVISNLIDRIMKRANMDDMLVHFLGNIVYTVLLLAVVMAALDHLGIQTTSLLAIFGAAGLAIGLALKDSLGNFSSGVMLTPCPWEKKLLSILVVTMAT